jgi:hypothetical protein
MTNRRSRLFLVVCMLITLACGVTGPLANATSEPSSSESSPVTSGNGAAEKPPTNPTASKQTEHVCEAAIVITGVDELDLGDGTKIVHVRIAFENKGNLWARLKGPDDDEDTETQWSVYIRTEDGSTYGFLGRQKGIPSELLPHPRRTEYEERGAVVTALIPPGFAILGQTVDGKPHYYGFAFRVPRTEVPVSISIKNMALSCAAPPELDHSSLRYVELAEDYSLTSDIRDVNILPSADNIPNLIGSRLEMGIPQQFIEFTGITRIGNTISVMFNYINDSPYEAITGFEGYIIGNSGFASCVNGVRIDCEDSGVAIPHVGPGQTFGSVVSFTMPEDETNLFLAVVDNDHTGFRGLYKINTADLAQDGASSDGDGTENPAVSSLCQNAYFPVSEGARWIYLVFDSRAFNSNNPGFLQIEIHNVDSDGFELMYKDSGVSTSSLKNDPSAVTSQWLCLPEGLATEGSGHGGLFLPSAVSVNSTWREAIGTDEEITYTALGVESIDVGGATYYAMKIKAVSRSEPDVVVYRWFAKGVGIVLSKLEAPTYGRVEQLVSYSLTP